MLKEVVEYVFDSTLEVSLEEAHESIKPMKLEIKFALK